MAKLGQFGKMSAKFSSVADFLTVYISEAHPREEANFTGNIDIGEHKTFEDRLEASQILLDHKTAEDNYSLVVDLMDNKAGTAYAATPERLYVVLDGKIVYEGLQGPFDYRLDEVEEYLERRSKLN